MNHHRFSPARHLLLSAVFGIGLTGLTATALSDQDPPPADQEVQRDALGRRIGNQGPVILAFNNVRISETLDFIVETTGKTVQPSTTVLGQQITIVNDTPMSRNEALNLLFYAFLEKRIGVIETDTIIRIDSINEITKGDVPVIPANVDIMDRTDVANIVNKVYRLQHTSAEGVQSVLQSMIPDDWAQIQVDAGSNSIIATVTIGIAQKLQRVINEIDIKSPAVTRSFRLRHADSTAVADYIRELFQPPASRAANPQQQQQQRGMTPQQQAAARAQQQRQQQQSSEGGTYVSEFRVTNDPAQNLVIVVSDPDIMEQIAFIIDTVLDVPISPEEDVVRIYKLEHRDVLVVQRIIASLQGGGGVSAPTGGGGGGGAAARAAAAAGSGSTGNISRLQDLYRLEADANTNELIVVARTAASFDVLDDLIRRLDTPSQANLPVVVELKHADAQQLSQQLNVLLAEAGLRADLDARDEGLEAFEGPGGTQATGGAQQTIAFWWQQPGAQRDDRSPESELIGKVRIVPDLRQNALVILGPSHYQNQVTHIIDQLDRPGRQVLISVVIAEVDIGDAMSLGLRFSQGGFPSADNRVGFGVDASGTINNIFGSAFDTSVLDTNMNVNVILDLLKSETGLRVLSQPRIFTSDNQQADFFDGQEVFVAEGSLTDPTGGVTQTLTPRQVGIILSVRPRITAEGEVDMLVSLELSSLSPTTTNQGGTIFDQRQTRTRVTVKDQQTIVLSGILRENESDIKRKVPLLGDIPLLGALFTSTETRQSRGEVVAFITPIVVNNTGELETFSQPDLQRLEEMRRPVNEQR